MKTTPTIKTRKHRTSQQGRWRRASKQAGVEILVMGKRSEIHANQYHSRCSWHMHLHFHYFLSPLPLYSLHICGRSNSYHTLIVFSCVPKLHLENMFAFQSLVQGSESSSKWFDDAPLVGLDPRSRSTTLHEPPAGVNTLDRFLCIVVWLVTLAHLPGALDWSVGYLFFSFSTRYPTSTASMASQWKTAELVTLVIFHCRWNFKRIYPRL